MFLHAVNEGPANKSYGLQVAQLAGIPREVISEAKQKLVQLESSSETVDFAPSNQAPKQMQTQEPQQNEIIAKLKSIDPNNLTPKEALELIFKLRCL